MKRTLNSVYATLCSQSSLASRKRSDLLLISRFSIALLFHRPPAAIRRMLVLITTPRRVCHCLRNIGLREISSSGIRPASSRCWVRRKQIVEKSGWEGGSFIIALVTPVLFLLAGIIPARRLSGIIKLQCLFRRNYYECHYNRTTCAVVPLLNTVFFSNEIVSKNRI